MIYCFRPGEDKERFLRLCRYILISVEKTDPKVWVWNNALFFDIVFFQLNFAALTLSKDSLSIWFNLMKQLLWKCCIMLEGLQPDLPNDTKHINLLLHVLVSFTSCNSWSFLKASKQGIKYYFILLSSKRMFYFSWCIEAKLESALLQYCLAFSVEGLLQITAESNETRLVQIKSVAEIDDSFGSNFFVPEVC